MTEPNRSAWPLIRAVGALQLKLLLDTVRDLALAPLALVAAAIDLALLRQREPELFRAVLRMGARSDRWIDVWSGGGETPAAHENVDSLLEKVERVVRDPQAGARRARVLKRWAERQLARARSRVATPAAGAPEQDAPSRDAG